MQPGDLVRFKKQRHSASVGLVVGKPTSGWRPAPAIKTMMKILWENGDIGDYWIDSLEVISESR